jgi:hypothetical protein
MAANGPLAARASVEEIRDNPLMEADPLEGACERISAVDVPVRDPNGTPMVVTKFAPDAESSPDEGQQAGKCAEVEGSDGERKPGSQER